MADWVAIKSEYINTTISTRDLAEKYEVSYSTLRKKAEKESWSKLRKEQGRKVGAKVAQKTADCVAASNAERIALLMDGGAKAARLLIRNLENMEASGEIRPYEIKATIDAMKGIKELYKVDDKDTPDDNLNEFLEGMKHA